MTIRQVCEKYGLTADTLRYYEKAGVIPCVTRTPGGIRDYTEEDIKWVENALCMRNAGVPVEMISEYVRLFQMGDSTFEARCNLLKQAKVKVEEARNRLNEELSRLDFKIAKYEQAIITGELNWDTPADGGIKK